jgi:putative CocE/NonD family hydrolase
VASTPVLPHPSWFARHGYAVVVQDARGRGDSGGTFSPFVDEGLDGAASVEWAAGLPFADGTVATYGFSYQGLNQLYTAAARPPSLRAIAPMMCCPDPYEGWTYEGGLLRWPFVCFWAAQLAGLERGTEPIPYDVGAWPPRTALGAAPPRWFAEWLAHPDGTDPYWQARRPDVGAIAVPVFTVLGWWDDFSSGTGALVERLAADGVDVELWCGPWGHMPWGGESPRPVYEALVAFFDRVLKGTGDPPDRPVRYHVRGRGWQEAPAWPPPHRVVRWRGHTDGDANSRWGDGVLVAVRDLDGAAEPEGPHAASPAGAPRSVLVVEPWVPYPGDPVAGQSEAAAEDRRDVLCFTSAPLARPLTIAGSPVVRVGVRADRPSHDVVATLVVVTGDGPDEDPRAISGSARRVGSGAPASARRVGSGAPASAHASSAHGSVAEVEITLRPIAWPVPAGARLRLDVSGARFPCFDRNPHGSADAPRVATIEVRTVELDLPVEPDPDQAGGQPA